jgi:DUF1680 family protein
VKVALDVDGLPVVVTQETSFPFEETVLIHIDPQADADFEVEIRIPAWCDEASATVSGVDAVSTSREQDRFRISGRWTPGSVIAITLPHRVRTVESRDGRTALAAGPLVYSLPIDSVATPHRRYDGTDYADMDLTRSSASALYPPALVGAKLHEATLEFATDTSMSPWESPTAALIVRALDPNPKEEAFEGAGEQTIRLRPFGATQLRWTAFPVVRS